MTELERIALEGLETLSNGVPADGVWSAPGRVNLIGEHTDYNEGFVLPFAIDRRTVVAARRLDEDVVRVASSSEDGVVAADPSEVQADSVSGWSAYPLGVAAALVENRGEASGVELFVHSDVPTGAGLSSSAALECAVAVALDDIWSLGLERADLARAGRRAENTVVGAPTGIMDQYASMLGAADAAVFLDCRSEVAEVVPLGLDEAGLVILVMDTRENHAHASGGYASRRASCERAAVALGVSALRDLGIDDLARAEAELDDETFRRVRHIVTENDRVVQTVATLRQEGPLAIGDLLLASHASMRDDYEISTPALDAAVEAAMAAGAVGARMTGGGFGGSAIALVASERVDEITAAVLSRFAEAGRTTPEIFTVRPSAGAGRGVPETATA
jgi:galactokinase